MSGNLSTLERFVTLAGSGRVLVMTGRFGRSSVRDAGYRLRARHRDLDFKLSWREFTSLGDWGERWPDEQHKFAAGLIMSPAYDPVVEQAVGRCLFDLARRGLPSLWGITSDRIRWCPRFMLRPNGWTLDGFLPYPAAAYARLSVAPDSAEFRPRFDPILYSAEPDYFISGSRLRWLAPDIPVTGDG